jgi:hypothetical protein
VRIDSIDYSREAFDKAVIALSRIGKNFPLTYALRKADVQDLIAAAQLEANHEYAYRLRGIVEPIDNPQF